MVGKYLQVIELGFENNRALLAAGTLVCLGAIHKRRPQSGGVCPVRTFFG